MNTLKDKIILITGATDGIGKETAIGLAKLGSKLFIVGRNLEKGKQVQEELKKATQNNEIQFLTADLINKEGINSLVKTIKERTNSIDILINNAGGLYGERWETKDGFEATYAMNHLSPTLLTWQLLPLLKKATKPRVINLTSSGHRFAKIDFANLQGEKTYLALSNYGNAKLANLMFMYYWAKDLKQQGISFFAADPGGASTDMTNKMKPEYVPAIMRPLWPLMSLSFGRDPIKSRQNAARSSIFAASSADLNNQTALYLSPNNKIVKSSRLSYNIFIQEQLWDLTITQLELPLESSIPTSNALLGAA